MRKTAVVALAAIGWWALSCKDIPAPEEGILSLSPVQLPSPGLVVGDTMRDSTGVAAPLRVVAYGVSGDTVAAPSLKFVVIDTFAVPGAHLAGAYLVGDKEGTTVHVIGSTEAIQTQPVPVKVTLRPDTLVATDSTVFHRTYSLLDTVYVALDATVSHTAATPTGVEAIRVDYAIEQQPPGVNGASTVALVLASRSNTLSSRDTTDASGIASRAARLAAPLKTTTGTDTALISATASYAGKVLGRVLYTLIYTSVP